MVQLNCDIRTTRQESYLFANVKYDVTNLMKYLDKKKVDVVIASNTPISDEMAKKYETEEQKDPVLIDYDEL